MRLGGRATTGAVAVAVALLVAEAPASGEVASAGGYEYVTERRSLDAPASTTAYSKIAASCPRGTHVLGGGHYNNRGFGVVEAAHSGPYDGGDRGRAPDDGWRAVLQRRDSVTATAYAICAPLMPTYVRKRVDVEGGATVTVRPSCRDAGDEPTSGGTSGNPRLRHTESGPYVQLAVEKWTLVVDNPTPETRSFNAMTVCAPLNLDHPVDAPSAVAAESQGSTSCPCAPGRFVVGGGQRYSPGGVVTVASRPTGFSAPAADGWQAWIDNFNAESRSFQAYAVCAKPLRR